MLEEVLQVTEERRITYLMLSSFFFEELSSSQLKEIRQSSLSFGGSLGKFHHELIQGDIEVMRKNLAADFSSLFLGMSKEPVSPYESVYTSKEQLLMQEARDEVLAEYRSENLDTFDWGQAQNENSNQKTKLSFYRLPEDHISFEFEYMAYLCGRTNDASQSGDKDAINYYNQKQKSFLENHLASWVPSFCDDVMRHARSSFYRGIAEITKVFIDNECTYMEEVNDL